MGEKKMIKKEGKSPSQKKKVAAVTVPGKEPWPNLPFVVSISHISGLGGIIKSWISPSSCFIHHQHNKQTWPQLVETNIYPETRYDDITIYSQGTRTEINMGAYKFYWNSNIPFQFSACNTRNPRTFKCLMVITGISSPAFAWDSKRTGQWRMKDCRLTDPYSDNDRYMELTNVIEFQDKYYAISRQGCLALIEDEGNSGIFEITALGRNRAVPYCKACRHFREYLLEYEGDIYLVFLISRASIGVVDSVEVFELDRSRLLWKKVDRLIRDAMFFVEDKCCLGISASSLRCSSGSWRGNCVYFTHFRADHTWFVYDMKTSCISTTSGYEVVRIR